MLKRQLITLTTLVVVIGLYLLFAALWDRSDPKAAMLHNVSANFTIYLTYGGTDYAEGSSIDIDQDAGWPGEETSVKVWDDVNRQWVTSDWAPYPGWLNSTALSIQAVVNMNDQGKIWYRLNGNTPVTYARVVCVKWGSPAEVISGTFTLY